MRRFRRPLASLLVLAACAAAPVREDPPANREDVLDALYVQFEEVLRRHRSLEGEAGEAAERERQELARLADEIAVRIVRIDPDANVEALIRKLEAIR